MIIQFKRISQRQSNNSLKLLISKELAGQEKEETDLTPISRLRAEKDKNN